MDRPIKAIEPSLQRPVGNVRVRYFVCLVGGHVPLPGHVGSISCRLKHLRNRDTVPVEISLILRNPVVAHHVANAGLVRIESGEKGSASGAATCRIVKLSEPKAIRGKAIECWGVNLSSVTTDVRVAHIVRHDKDDIWATICGGQCWWCCQSKKKSGEEERSHVQSLGGYLARE